MEIVFYIRIKKMYGICLVINEEDPRLLYGRIYLGLTYSMGSNRYGSWKELFMWKKKF